ncbi:hypothetical protein ACWKWU_17840 [Chitinophaga lutea]
MEPIVKRLQQFMQYKRMNATDFSRYMNYPNCEKVARLFRVEGAKPSADILMDIALYFDDLNMRWLLVGEGEMLGREQRSSLESRRVRSLH